MAIEMKKTKVKTNKPIYFGMSILDISKRLMYKFWYDYIKPRQVPSTKTKQNYATWILTALSFLLKPKYEDIANDVEKWFDTSNYDNNTPLEIKM